MKIDVIRRAPDMVPVEKVVLELTPDEAGRLYGLLWLGSWEKYHDENGARSDATQFTGALWDAGAPYYSYVSGELVVT